MYIYIYIKEVGGIYNVYIIKENNKNETVCQNIYYIYIKNKEKKKRARMDITFFYVQ